MTNTKELIDNINQKIDMAKATIAVLISPIFPSIVFTIYMYIRMTSNSSTITIQEGITISIYLGGIALIVMLIHALLFGLPLLFLGLYFNIIRWWSILIGAFIIGFMPCTVFLHLESQKNVLVDHGLSVVNSIAGLFGCIGGITFWLLWRYWVLQEN